MRTWAPWTLVLLFLGGLTFFLLGVRSIRQARSVSNWQRFLAPASMSGTAFLCFALFAAGFYPFGGRVPGGGITPDFRACSAWWAELPAHHHRLSNDYRSAQYCHAQAVDALAPVLTISIAIGLTIGASVAVFLTWRGRRFDAALRAFADRTD